MITKSRPLIVGVFTSESSIATINSIALSIGLDIIQLHGDGCVDPRYCNRPVICAGSIESVDVDDHGGVCMRLIDGATGGSGEVWDWNQKCSEGAFFTLASGLNM